MPPMTGNPNTTINSRLSLAKPAEARDREECYLIFTPTTRLLGARRWMFR